MPTGLEDEAPCGRGRPLRMSREMTRQAWAAAGKWGAEPWQETTTIVTQTSYSTTRRKKSRSEMTST